MRLSTWAFGIGCFKKRVTYINNEVLTSKHDCVFDLFDIDLHLPKPLANSRSFSQSWSEHPFCDYYPDATVYSTKQTHRVLKDPQCPCKLCVKDGSETLKSLCINKISEFNFCSFGLRNRYHCKCSYRLLKNLLIFNPTVNKLLFFTEHTLLIN